VVIVLVVVGGLAYYDNDGCSVLGGPPADASSQVAERGVRVLEAAVDDPAWARGSGPLGS
ncbi:MAG: hypothetical protein ACE5E8_07890, partial [Acidimicrobiia bacterium]